jgi:hypothetical protein
MGDGFISQGTITTSGTGALNVNAIFYEGVFYLSNGVLDSVTNDGTIAVSNTNALLLEGTVTNNGSMIANSGGYFVFLPGGSLVNNGSINVTQFAAFQSESSVVNNGSIIASPGGYFQIFSYPDEHRHDERWRWRYPNLLQLG